MISKTNLETIAINFDTSKDFDSVLAFYDVLEISQNLRGKYILEMGSSAGTVTKYLLPHADRLDLVEGSHSGIQRTKMLLGDTRINYFHECWENFEPNQGYSDIVFIRGLEHVEKPRELLHRMKNWLTPGGRIHIVVPNAHSLHRRIMVERGQLSDVYALRDRDFHVGHVQVYDKNTLEKDVRESGLNITHSTGYFVKPVSTSEMGLLSMDPKHPFIESCYSAGKLFPELGTQLYVIGEQD